ncbi:ABC transporter ATP-binding protein [Lysinibacillus agricola]|uniref:ABC transporter ATP-binding protein n=1 Tax=Lysinibacillus agricola TaxID=2590012 RepID=A0ABX7ALD2_9BACI|nr:MULTISPECIES: ABC transporter ATP-binding protein [Lysinibacillus]KOS62250.1 ABC transporter [Lysinibacillus sp. FJAT-14222]QQP10521.1 ABC transporter ATP-binding protein [Lysinibacillus agricola]
MRKLISASQLTKSYKTKCVVDHINVDIKEGEVVALIGSNGAGKTTTIGMLLGIIPQDSGTIEYWTTDYKKEMGTQLQSTPFFEGYSVEDNVKLFGAFYGLPLTNKKVEEKLAAFDLLQVKKTPALKLSIGQQKRLAIIVTTLHNPKLVILDEPSAGLDPRGQKEIQQIIKRLKDSGVAVLFSSHDMLEVMNVADRILIMHHGKIIANGSPDSLMAQYQIQNLEELFFELTK